MPFTIDNVIEATEILSQKEWKKQTLKLIEDSCAEVIPFPTTKIQEKKHHGKISEDFLRYHEWRSEHIDPILATILYTTTYPLLSWGRKKVLQDSPNEDPYFRQKRYGQNDRIIEMIKLRSCKTNAKQVHSRSLHSRYNDAITKPGIIVRRTRIDELPQLLLVMQKELSLIGPRALMLEDEDIEFRRKTGLNRFRPGVISPAKIYGGDNLPIDECNEIDLNYAGPGSLYDFILRDMNILTRLPLVPLIGSKELLKTAYNTEEEKLFSRTYSQPKKIEILLSLFRNTLY